MQLVRMGLWTTVLCLGVCSATVAQDSALKPPADESEPCQGTLQLDGKTYRLEHVAIYETTALDEDAVAVLMSDKPIPFDKLRKAVVDGNGSDDSLILFQAHVKVTFTPEGKPRFCNAWADNFSLSVSGTKLVGELAIKDGLIAGKTALSGDKGSFTAVFNAPLMAFPRKAPATKPAEPKSGDKPRPKGKAEAPAGSVNVHDLPLPKDASQVEYKQLVQQLTCKSATDHKTLAKELSDRLAAQGWKTSGSDLVGPASAILRRELGKAELTVFVKPDGGGSKITVMSKGLSWEPKETAPKDK